jgi:hypothetical protein
MPPSTKIEMEISAKLRQSVNCNPMPEQPKPSLPPVLLAFAPIHKTALGVASGVVLGGMIFLMTAILLIKGGPRVGANLMLIGQYSFGYTVTWMGSLIGLAWGFAVGFLIGWSFALVHNSVVWIWLNLVRSRAEMEEYGDLLDHL